MTPQKTNTITNLRFAKDVLQGLSEQPKRLPSKYFYDAEGDRLFQEIMAMPEYYLTKAEFEILGTHKAALLERFGPGHFDLVELGAGDGYKTKVLLEHFLAASADFTYCPVDISGNVLEHLEADLHQAWPQLPVQCMKGDYFQMLESLQYRSEAKKVILFLGANIGNLGPARARQFLRRIYQHMDPGDLLLIGFDLKKDPEVILNAYNDAAGITAAFNLNLLRRINRELGANFQLDQFKHWETYHPITGATRSFLVSKQEQEVQIEALDQSFQFQAWEAIEVELSQKYHPLEIEQLAKASGFSLVRHFTDSRQYFIDSLWEKS